MKDMQQLLKGNLYTILLNYKKNLFIYQVLASNEIEAQLKWIKKINLNEIGAINANGIKEELISEAKEEFFFPVVISKFQNIWNTTVTSLSHNDSINKEYPIAYIIATLDTNKIKNINRDQINNNLKLPLFHSLKGKILYTIQLDYKGNIYVEQVFLAGNYIDAKIAWIKQFDFSIISTASKNIEETKNELRTKLLLQQKESNFIPLELKEFDSVWSTGVQLGDETGRVTIVATKTNI